MSEQFTWPFDLDLGFDRWVTPLLHTSLRCAHYCLVSYPTLSEPVVPSLTEFEFYYPSPWTDTYAGQQPEEPVPKPQYVSQLWRCAYAH